MCSADALYFLLAKRNKTPGSPSEPQSAVATSRGPPAVGEGVLLTCGARAHLAGPDHTACPWQVAWRPGPWRGRPPGLDFSQAHVASVTTPFTLGNGCFKSFFPVNQSQFSTQGWFLNICLPTFQLSVKEYQPRGCRLRPASPGGKQLPEVRTLPRGGPARGPWCPGPRSSPRRETSSWTVGGRGQQEPALPPSEELSTLHR